MSDLDKKVGEMEINDASNPWPATKIRNTFINYFTEKNGHTMWPSSPVVPVNDPTLLFANAGMNQFKPLFLGTCDPTLEMSKLKRATNSQKCIRAGGKHNDLEDVGKDVYHHTFFEMLGNWSFGDYFKDEAISYAWECLTKEFGLNPDRLYATYFGGDETQGLAPDLEAKEFWKRFLPESRIIACGCKDNFWEMGATGPCGPCSEVHYDRIGNRDASALVNADLPDVIEIWNVVFIQFNREADGSLKELPSKHVDTGMGFERLASILQGKDSNYDTDIFTPIFQGIQALTQSRAYQGKLGEEDAGLVDMAYRVIADHIRTLTFAITDGAVPSSEGRGYVLRRILRRAVRYGQEMLKAPSGFFTQLVPIVVTNFSNFFPELKAREKFVMAVIADEEASFNRTLDQGVKHFNKVSAALLNSSGGESSSSKNTVVSARDAHILFSSMGFPLDLTELMAAERGLTVDVAGFEALMEQDRKISEAAKLARQGGGSKDLGMEAEQTAWLMGQGVSTTNSEAKYTWYSSPSARVLALYHGRGLSSDHKAAATAGFTDTASAADGLIGVVLSDTSFYYESGGQIYDTGVLHIGEPGNAGSFTFAVTNCQTYAGYVVHVGSVVDSLGGGGACTLKVGTSVAVKVDYERRSYVAPNHTMTHVLNYALRSVLLTGCTTSELPPPPTPAAAATVGAEAAAPTPAPAVEAGLSQCDQKGSLVDADKLRFDFSWSGALTIPQITLVQEIVNKRIQASLPVYAEVVPLADATRITSLRQVFGEKYPDPVRVISVGTPIPLLLAEPANPHWSHYSVEFCGGTHLTNTNEAGAFVIVEETGIAKGVRRIVGLTRKAAQEARANADALLGRFEAAAGLPGGAQLSAEYKALKQEVDHAVVSLVDKDLMRSKLSKLFETMRAYFKANLATRVNEATEKCTTAVNSNATAAVLVMAVDIGADGKIAKKLIETMRGINPNGSYLLASLDDEGEKVGVYPAVSAAHIAQGLSAKAWVEALIQKAGRGKGGGKPDLANASFPCNSSSSDGGAEASVSPQAFLTQLLTWGNEYATTTLSTTSPAT